MIMQLRQSSAEAWNSEVSMHGIVELKSMHGTSKFTRLITMYITFKNSLCQYYVQRYDNDMMDNSDP